MTALVLAALLIGAQFTSMTAAAASTGAWPAGSVSIGYTAPRHFGEIPSAAMRRALSDCPGARFCAWHGINYTSTRTEYANAQLSVGVSLPGSGHNNTGSSWYNNFGCGSGCSPSDLTVWLYESSNCHDNLGTEVWSRHLARGQTATAQGSDWNDRVSSYNFNHNVTC